MSVWHLINKTGDDWIMERRHWASRTSRGYDEYFWGELQQGRLRQGWGYHEDQDLRTVAQLSWQGQSPDQKATSRQRRMLGGEDGWQEGDIVLVPNMPEQGMFALVEITGPYRFEIDVNLGDFGHIREVSLLTPQGVANTNELVHASIRSTLRNAGRAREIRWRDGAIEALISHAQDKTLIEHSTNAQRTAKVRVLHWRLRRPHCWDILLMGFMARWARRNGKA